MRCMGKNDIAESPSKDKERDFVYRPANCDSACSLTRLVNESAVQDHEASRVSWDK